MSIIIKSGSSQNLATVNSDGSIKTAGTIASSTGTIAGFRPDGTLRAAPDATSLFFDNFETFDTVNAWTPVTTAPALLTGNLSFAAGTASGASSIIRTIPTFPSLSNSFLQPGAVVSVDANPITGNKRFWGLGFPAAVPTAALPLSSGVVFELSDTDGALYGAVYANGARVKSVALTRPTDGLLHRYVMYYRTSKVFFEIDGVSVGSIDSPNPSVSAMPIALGSINGTAQATSPSLNVTVVGMADSSRNNIQISDSAFPHRKVQVGKSGGLSIKGANGTPVSLNLAAGATGILGPIDVSEFGNVSFILKNQVAATAYTGNPVIVFEQSDDGVSWSSMQVVRTDTNSPMSTVVMAPGAANTSVMFDVGVEGVGYVRARVVVGTTTGGLTLVGQPGGLPFSPIVSVAQPVRLPVLLSGVSLPVGASGSEVLLTMTQQKGITATSPSTSFSTPMGKRFRIQTMLLSQVGNNTATVATTIFRMRYNASGPVTTASNPVMMQARLATPAQAGAYQQIVLPIPDGFELQGDGVGTFGVSVNSVYVSNPPTVDVMITGYEY